MMNLAVSDGSTSRAYPLSDWTRDWGRSVPCPTSTAQAPSWWWRQSCLQSAYSSFSTA